MQQIKVVISSTGEISYSVHGVKGSGCKALTKAIDNISGGKVLETKNTGEFCELPAVNQQLLGK